MHVATDIGCETTYEQSLRFKKWYKFAIKKYKSKSNPSTRRSWCGIWGNMAHDPLPPDVALFFLSDSGLYVCLAKQQTHTDTHRHTQTHTDTHTHTESACFRFGPAGVTGQRYLWALLDFHWVDKQNWCCRECGWAISDSRQIDKNQGPWEYWQGGCLVAPVTEGIFLIFSVMSCGQVLPNDLRWLIVQVEKQLN